MGNLKNQKRRHMSPVTLGGRLGWSVSFVWAGKKFQMNAHVRKLLTSVLELVDAAFNVNSTVVGDRFTEVLVAVISVHEKLTSSTSPPVGEREITDIQNKLTSLAEVFPSVGQIAEDWSTHVFRVWPKASSPGNATFSASSACLASLASASASSASLASASASLPKRSLPETPYRGNAEAGFVGGNPFSSLPTSHGSPQLLRPSSASASSAQVPSSGYYPVHWLDRDTWTKPGQSSPEPEESTAATARTWGQRGSLSEVMSHPCHTHVTPMSHAPVHVV
jgi:hypothetical protein